MPVKSARWSLLAMLLASAVSAESLTSLPVGETGGLQDLDRAKGKEWIQLFVNRGERVRAGQVLAVQRNVLGKVVLEYVAGSAGEVTVSGQVDSGELNATLEIGPIAAEGSCRGENCED